MLFRFLAALISSFALVACGGGGGSAIAGSSTSVANSPSTASTPSTTSAPVPTLQIPANGIGAADLAVIVLQGDALSEAIGSYYQTQRGLPAANIIRVSLTNRSDSITSTEFARFKADIDAKLSANIQATVLTWTAPSRVAGSCSMSITSALALGYDAKYCGGGCSTTAASGYFDAESTKPWTDLGIRPSMMLGASTLASAKTLIDRGVSADATNPAGTGYLLRTSDSARSVRYSDYIALPATWSGTDGLQLLYVDNSAGAASDTLANKANILFYFTGLTSVASIANNTFRPGAAADHLTSFGGYLPGGNGQMPITAWLEAGATASYGTVEEPCNYTQKFPQASTLIDHYYRGDSLLEAYWKSVQWPGQGLFVGEPLAQPFRSVPTLTVSGSQYLVSTRSLRAGASYALDYRTAPSSVWYRLGSFSVKQARPTTISVPLPPNGATHIRLVGPCPGNSAQQCTLSTTP